MSRPILTPKTVLPLFFSIGIIFAPIGGLLLYASSQVSRLCWLRALVLLPCPKGINGIADGCPQVQELSIDYTKCTQLAPNSTTNWDAVPDSYISSQFKNKTTLSAQWRQDNTSVAFDGVETAAQKCIIQFDIPEDMGPPVLFYYQLTNFYQNHRRYVQSFDSKQLAGTGGYTNGSVNSDCQPLEKDTDGLPYYPCGLIANSIFNDTFSNLTIVGSSGSNYTMLETGIAWDSDKSLYKKLPSNIDLNSIAVPPNWALRYPNGYTDANPPPDIRTNEHFIVWMRTAALPDFSKLYMRNDDTKLAKGQYQVEITNCMFGQCGDDCIIQLRGQN